MDSLSEFVVSHGASAAEQNALREWEMTLCMNNIQEKCCTTINLYNGVPIVPMALVTKESKSLLSKLMEVHRGKVYSLHRMIILLYVPSILKGTPGQLSIKLLNTATSEAIDVVTDHPANSSAVFVARWPRAVLTTGAGISLVFSATGVPTKTGSLIGSVHPYWEDKMSTKMVYEKQLPTLVYPLEEQDPSHYIKDVKMLRSVIASRVHMGGQGADTAPQAVAITRPNVKMLGGSKAAATSRPVSSIHVGDVEVSLGHGGRPVSHQLRR